MRLVFLIPPMLALGACAAPAPQVAPPVNTAQAAAVFNVPMDPGLIQCAQLSNPAAMSAATDWLLGKARASALSGGSTTVPDTPVLTSNLASYCSTNAGATVRSAATQFGY